jgi:hypothetical protein
VQTMVKILLNLKQEPEPHDASDALAIALCHSFHSSRSKHKQGRWRSYSPPQERRADSQNRYRASDFQTSLRQRSDS